MYQLLHECCLSGTEVLLEQALWMVQISSKINHETSSQMTLKVTQRNNVRWTKISMGQVLREWNWSVMDTQQRLKNESQEVWKCCKNKGVDGGNCSLSFPCTNMWKQEGA